MSNSPKENLEKAGITLPTPVAPVANYVTYVQTGNILSVSGQLPLNNEGKLPYVGKVGLNVTPEEANKAARLCAINIISQINAALGGDLNRVVRIIKLGAFVNCVDSFPGQPAIVNGASDLMVEVFGDKGKHSRSAVGTNALPLNVPVEIDALIEIS
ncbi:MAG: RidA family protein [Kordiimonadaceae bacterium]|jgi:enamine deaminase RidA (YjgF/YER057c/UK114 family)|nr:RidA family protein [Kordiimonadaceae bacterium]MBT6034856.1 RidA family protein [Kordiimonadaceae bacterium]MBT6329752.1 RidA family protein [Kordiimonadaceae bacterium]MBT7582547.1 RidA family protein [Kordiimonadaceae bacterium]